MLYLREMNRNILTVIMIQMNRNLMTAILLICISTYCHSQSTIVKKAPDSKQVIHTMDTLALLPPFVDIKIIDEKNNYLNDTVLSPKLSENISKMITDLLKKKYSLKNLSGNSTMNSNVVKDFNELDNNIYKSENLLTNIEFPDSIFKAGNNTSRYCMTSIINGYYYTKEKLRQDAKKVLPASIAVAVLTLGHFYLVPNNPSVVTLRIILYDRVDKRVLFYKSTNLCNNLSAIYIPRASYSELNQVIMTSYKPMYYK